MAEDVVEKKKIRPSITRRRSPEAKDKSGGSKEVEFVFVKGEEVLETKKVALEEVANDPSVDGKAKCEYELPEVDAGEDSYALAVRHCANGVTIWSSLFNVWPETGKITVKDKEDKALKGFRFKLVQAGEEDVELAVDADSGELEFALKPGKPYTIEPIAPWAFEEDPPIKGHERSVKGKLVLEAEFVAPVSADPIKQWVNLTGDDAKKGRDGSGREVTVQIGVKGDTARPDDQKIGRAGRFLFVHVAFAADAGGTRSKRDDPAAELVDGLNLKNREQDGATAWKGQVELAGDKGIGEFKVALGIAGGDKCTIKIGGDDRYADATLELVNWRRLYYELNYPSCAVPVLNALRPASGNDSGVDIPSDIKQKVEERTGAAYIDYALLQSKSFGEDDVRGQLGGTAWGWTTAGYLKEGGNAAAPRFFITDGTFQKLASFRAADAIHFESKDEKRCMPMLLCHKCYYKDAKEDVDRTLDANPGAIAMGREVLPIDGDDKDCADSIDYDDTEWTADIAANTHVKPDIQIDIEDANVGGSEQTVEVQELLHGRPAHTVEFTQGRVGHAPTTLKTDQKRTFENWFKGFLSQQGLIQHGKRLHFKIRGPGDNARRKARRDHLKSVLQEFHTAQPGFLHPALKPDGTPRSGKLDKSWFQWNTITDIAIQFPTDAPESPGSWIGALSDTKAPINVQFGILRARGYNGMVWLGAQIVGLRPGATPGAVASTFCHELGHAMGMTIMPGKSVAPTGADPAKHVDNGGSFYRNPGSGEDADVGHAAGKGIRRNHSGSHCAHGIADTTPDSLAGLAGSCIMYGEGGDADSRPSYCPTCLTFLKARRLEDIRGSWSSRSAVDS